MSGLSTYNGFSGKERSATDRLQKKAITEGRLKLKKICCVCGQTQGAIMMHLENYFKPLDPDEIKEMCVECHLSLHSRFRKPNTWIKRCLDARKGIKSKPYYSAWAYIQETNIHSTDLDPIEFIPDKTKWWECLSFEKQDLRNTLYLQQETELQLKLI